MRRALLGLIVVALAPAPTAADYYSFTGTISFPESSRRFLPKGVSLSGSGVGFSSVAPNEIQLVKADGFTGTLKTSFGSTAGYVQQAFLTRVSKGDFSQPTSLGGLRGKMAVGGMARRNNYASFPLTANEMTGLGLGGTLAALKGGTPSVRFGTWTIGLVNEKKVITESMVALGTYMIGTIAETGFDARTSMGMGTVQLVTPIRTIAGVPADRGAIAKLTLNFAPEPGRAVLMLGGCLALALLGALRARPAVNE